MSPKERSSSGKPFLSFVIAGVLLRVVATILAGNDVFTPWRVGGDAPFYVRLAANIASGKGFAYYAGATAFRPPAYPYFLAAMMRLFGNSAPIAVRIVQLGAGLVTAWVCARTTSRLFGEQTGRIALVVALFVPTLAAFPTELMTECFATLLTALFLDFILSNPALSKWSVAALVGLVVGLACLLRFNMAILGLVALAAIAGSMEWPKAWPRMCLVTAVAGLVVAPWIVRNLIVFHGRVILSTQGGINAVQGVLTPQGRAQEGDLEVLRSVVGWHAADIESNEPPGYDYKLASEPDLDRKAWALTFELWRQENWKLIPLSLKKLGYFWLSTDQIFSTKSFSLKQRLIRLCGVGSHWILMLYAIMGWVRLRRTEAKISHFLLGYVVLVSAAHLPFIMTSRYRVPFMETALVMLAANGYPLFSRQLAPPKLSAADVINK